MSQKQKKKFKLTNQYFILSNGASWIAPDHSINRFKFKEKDWKNHYIWIKSSKSAI